MEETPWHAAKQSSLAEINADGFRDRADRYLVLDRVELMDRIESATAAPKT